MGKKRLFRIQDVNAVREPGQLAVTVDGTLAAMSVAELTADGGKIVPRIWLLDADAPEGARPVTTEGKRASLPAFSGDGRRLAYLAEQDDDKMQLVLLTAPFSEPKVLTHFEHGARYFEWLDGRRLLVLASPNTPARKKKALDDKDDAYEVDVDEPRARMWLVGLGGGGKPKPIGPTGAHVCFASASPDGKTIAYVLSRHSTMDSLWLGSTLRVLNVRSGRSRLLRKMSAPVSAMWKPQWSPDGTRLAVVDGIRKGMIYPQRIFVVSLDGKRAVTIDRRVDRLQSAPKWLDDETVLYIQQNGTSPTLRAAPASGGEGRDLVQWPGAVSDHAAAPATGRVLFVYSETDKPPEVYSVGAGDGMRPQRLTTLNRRLSTVRHSPGEIVRWKSREGWTVEGLFLRPTKNVRAPYATVIIPHGGPHGAVSNGYGILPVQVYCARGYAVFLPNFRGSTGYGTKFLLSIRKNWGGPPADDIVRGISHLIRRRLVDPKRIVVNGGSYGGYMTAWLIGHYGSMFRAAVAHAPVVNNISMWGTTDIPSFKEWSYGGRPLTTFKRYWQQSPISSLKGCKVPTLVIVGDVDLRVPPNQAQELYRTVKSEGAPAALVRYPREPHGIGEPRHKTDAMKRQLAWIKQHLGKDCPEGRNR